MYTGLSSSKPTARKEHYCNACEHLLLDGTPKEGGFSPAEWKAIEKAKANNWKIQKGEKYLKQVGVFDGDFQTFKAIKEIHDICLEHDYYNYDY